MLFWLTPIVVSVGLAVVSLLAKREQKGLHSGDTFTMSRSLISAALAVALICLCMAGGLYFFGNAHQESDALVPLAISGASVLCSLVWGVYAVRLSDSAVSVGLFGGRAISYGLIACIVEIRNQGSPRALLVTKNGRKIAIWSNLVGFDSLVQRLLASCPGATHRCLERRGERFEQ